MKHFLLLALCLLISACGGSSTNPDPVNEVVETDNPIVDDEDPGIVDDEDDPVVPPGSAQLAVLSNRPDLISGGDVLVEVVLGDIGDLPRLELTRNGDDVTAVLQATPDNSLRMLGVVDDLNIGDNTLAVNLGNSIVVTNHPNEGPVFSGPHLQPWACQGSAVDEFCNQPVQYLFEYRPVTPPPPPPPTPEDPQPELEPTLLPYDPENPPDDVMMTTTENGETVPFIVRREIGYMARDQYEIKTLFKPGEAWIPAQPQSQWNGKLLVTHGGSCGGDHDTNSPRFVDYAGTIPEQPAIDNSFVTALSQGWSVLSTAQLNLGHNCSLAYQAESLMMVKERYVEQYGELRYTIGSGCSGGSITQNMIANAYPGLYNALLTTCTYPDVMSTATQFADYHILLRYFQTRLTVPEEPETPEEFFEVVMNAVPDPEDAVARDGTAFTVAQQNAIYGHENGILNATLADDLFFFAAVNPEHDCDGVPEPVANDPATRYDSDTNPGGVRCDVLTFMENMIGPRDRNYPDGSEAWSQNEIALERGFAGFPLGNEGVQYGLVALRNGEITPAQFVALNTNIGAVDTDIELTARQDEADETSPRLRLRPDSPALPNAYRTGILNTIVNMDTVPIINMTGPDPGIAHDSVHGYWLRYRFEREFPDISREQSNFVMWGGPTPLIGDANYLNQSLVAMAGWLDAIEQDTSRTPLAQKILASKPADLTDQCSSGSGQAPAPGMCSEESMLVFGTPRTEAGDDVYGDMVQCRLRPFDESDYDPVTPLFTAEQLQTLRKTFATGVCDFTPPAGPLDDPRDPELARPIGWEPTITWLSYQDEMGEIIHGGVQMEAADYPRGWASPAFSGAWAPGFARGD